MIPDTYPKAYLYKRIVQAKLYIDNCFAEHIDLENISDEAYFSKYHFIRLFKRAYGKTPHQYLMKVRIEKAMQLLETGTSVSDTCFAVGFASLSSFSGLFKRIVGINPTEYQIQKEQLKALVHNAPLQFIPGCHARSNGGMEKSNFEEAGI